MKTPYSISTTKRLALEKLVRTSILKAVTKIAIRMEQDATPNMTQSYINKTLVSLESTLPEKCSGVFKKKGK